MTRRPPTPTLFPCTTLFRSDRRAHDPRLVGGQRMGVWTGRFARVRHRVLERGVRALGAGAVDEDRKSTRLNSSHGYISYAVFCLKKKKRRKHTDRPLTLTLH